MDLMDYPPWNAAINHDPLLSQYSQGSPLAGMDSPGMDLTSQSSSYLDPDCDMPDGFKEESDLNLDMAHSDYLDIAQTLKGNLTNGDKSSANKGKKKGTKGVKDASFTEASRRNFPINADESSKKWVLIETDQETLFGSSFKKKVWIREDWPEQKKQERLRGFVWTEELFQQAARGDFDDMSRSAATGGGETGEGIKKKKKKKKRTTPDPPEILQAMSDLQAYGKTLEDGSAVCTFPGCNKQFANISSFRKHRKSHAPKCHTCEVCGRSFTENSKLRRHYVVHTGEKPFQVPSDNNSLNSESVD
ncbi:hypothetical protein RvY_15389-2 [Ramazzottius varieornatus]|uniref:C2H2-type domain-containing protein n=1 Tax=Ramazzottius varieornatus TaxID=947166 RepID=A0A1D1VY19_RAMVA|nr:hypothetical protein RvY_15389-2 [Ramazzottius varieornatus]